ncbi:unnamed protein product [Acanthosepion pharaonis]|uniref:Uncharacterized protein n=1 Tax=Acanthosepion pharaonis TaxID=158019 RepID=A0A812CUY1_ACAPH|nr:unnamed protein product [Sepia pharaonis]
MHSRANLFCLVDNTARLFNHHQTSKATTIISIIPTTVGQVIIATQFSLQPEFGVPILSNSNFNRPRSILSIGLNNAGIFSSDISYSGYKLPQLASSVPRPPLVNVCKDGENTLPYSIILLLFLLDGYILERYLKCRPTPPPAPCMHGGLSTQFTSTDDKFTVLFQPAICSAISSSSSHSLSSFFFFPKELLYLHPLFHCYLSYSRAYSHSILSPSLTGHICASSSHCFILIVLLAVLVNTNGIPVPFSFPCVLSLSRMTLFSRTSNPSLLSVQVRVVSFGVVHLSSARTGLSQVTCSSTAPTPLLLTTCRKVPKHTTCPASQRSYLHCGHTASYLFTDQYSPKTRVLSGLTWSQLDKTNATFTPLSDKCSNSNASILVTAPI